MFHWPLDPAAFGAVFLSLYIAHGVADHWLQTDWQANRKGQRDSVGRLACAMHVANYTVATCTAALAAILLFDLDVSPWGLLAGQIISATTHYWADRRYTLEWLCDRLGKGEFYRLGKQREVVAMHDSTGTSVTLYEPCPSRAAVKWDNPSLGTGAYVLDQWWHLFWLVVAAGVTVAVAL